MSTETQHLGTKIEQERLRLGMLKRDLATHFDMKQPSVTEMLQTGRLAKEKYQRLVDLNGRSLDWWFDIVAPQPVAAVQLAAEPSPKSGMRMASHLMANAPAATYQLKLPEPSQQGCTEGELVQLFNTLPRAEQSRFPEELRSKAAFYHAALEELMERQHLTASH
jgi:hypothetical protein